MTNPHSESKAHSIHSDIADVHFAVDTSQDVGPIAGRHRYRPYVPIPKPACAAAGKQATGFFRHGLSSEVARVVHSA